MTAVEAIAQREAELSYAVVYDAFADLEQQLAGTPDAEVPHHYACLAISAYRAEMDDRDVGSEVDPADLSATCYRIAMFLRAWSMRIPSYRTFDDVEAEG